MINQNFLLIGFGAELIAGIWYIVSTAQGKIQPNRVSWFLWALADMTAFFAEIKQGVGIQSLLTLFVGLGPILVLTASFMNKKAYWKIWKLDLICGAFSLIGLTLWIITQVGNIAIVFSILADASASLPTIVKSYRKPESESSLMYWGVVLLGILTVLTIRKWSFAEAAFPIYITLINSLIASLVLFKIGKKKLL